MEGSFGGNMREKKYSGRVVVAVEEVHVKDVEINLGSETRTADQLRQMVADGAGRVLSHSHYVRSSPASCWDVTAWEETEYGLMEIPLSGYLQDFEVE